MRGNERGKEKYRSVISVLTHSQKICYLKSLTKSKLQRRLGYYQLVMCVIGLFKHHQFDVKGNDVWDFSKEKKFRYGHG